MIQLYHFVILLLLIPCIGNSQIRNESDSRENSFGYCLDYTFNWYSNSFNVSNFNSSSISVGFSYAIPVIGECVLSIDPSFGVVFKKKYDNRFDIIGKIDKNRDLYPVYTVHSIDEIDMVFNQYHASAEIPVNLSYYFNKSIGAMIGVGGKYYFSNGSVDVTHLDFFERSLEWKLYCGISMKIFKMSRFQVIYGHALNRIYSKIIVYPTNSLEGFDAYLLSRGVTTRLIIPFK